MTVRSQLELSFPFLPERVWREWLCAALLTVSTLLVLSSVLRCGFVNYDDTLYVTQNGHVRSGLTTQGLVWAWTTHHAHNWHPLTWLSLMLDAQVFGLRAWGYHLTNVVLHVANTLLLFFFLRRTTGVVWRSAVVAGLFALHPLHVESVAWVSARKDLLSTFFGLVALLGYARYASAPGLGRYLTVMLALALSLLAKPMLVTLPCLLLVLDYWPLRRWQPVMRSAEPGTQVSIGWLVLEKFPLLILSAASGARTVWAQQQALEPLAHLSFLDRLGNAVVSYVVYLRQTLLPWDLAVYYPHPRDGLAVEGVVAAALLLPGASVLIIRLGKTFPYLPVGWLWYVGTLVPVIGLVQVGTQAHADRYTYFPLIGIFMLVTWGVADLCSRWRLARLSVVAAGVALTFCMLISWGQVQHWRDSLALWQRAVQATANNSQAHFNLGATFHEQGKFGEALRQYQEVLRIDPSFVTARVNAATLLTNMGRNADAVAQFEEALRLDPNSYLTHNNLGVAWLRQAALAKAIPHFREAVRLNPGFAQAHGFLAQALEMQGDWQEAISCLKEAVTLQPAVARYRRDLAFALEHEGRIEEAQAEYRESLRLDPSRPNQSGSTITSATRPAEEYRR